jgi:hypothetical protein
MKGVALRRVKTVQKEAKMCHVRGVAVALLSAALVTEAYSLDAAATVVDLDEFAVVRNGTTIFDDSFNRNTTLNGGSGTGRRAEGLTAVKAEVDLSENDIQMVVLDMRATSLIWVTSGCAGPPAAWQVNLNKRTPNSSALTWRSVTRRPDDNVLDRDISG